MSNSSHLNVILGPGFKDLGLCLTRLNVPWVQVERPEQAWTAHQQSQQPKCWLVGDQDWLQPFCLPPWQGLYHLIARLHSTELQALDCQAQLLVGDMNPDRLADLIAGLAWRTGQAQHQTQRADITGSVQWIDSSPIPKQLTTHTGTVAVAAGTQPSSRWPYAQWVAEGLDANISSAPLLIPHQWQSQRIALDALAQLKTERYAQID